MTQHSGKSFPLRKPFAAAGRLVGAVLRYLLTNVFPELGLLLSPTLTSFIRAVTYLGSVGFLAGAGVCVVRASGVSGRRRAAVTLLLTAARIQSTFS